MPHYMTNPPLSPKQVALAHLSKCRVGDELDAWGLARESGLTPLAAQEGLTDLENEGLALSDGPWYGPTATLFDAIGAEQLPAFKDE